jgi:hypothetical protein
MKAAACNMHADACILRQLNAAAQLCDVRPVKPMIVMEAA